MGILKKNKQKKKQYILSFNEEELANPNIRAIIRELINLKLNMQRYNSFYTISQAEFIVLSKFSSEFVDKSKYESQTQFKGEVGKIRGKRLVIQE